MITSLSAPISLSFPGTSVQVQPIRNHGVPAWRIFKPNGDYICQFNARLAALTVCKWAGKVDPQSVERTQLHLENMQQEETHAGLQNTSGHADNLFSGFAKPDAVGGR